MLTTTLFKVYDIVNTSEEPVILNIEIGFGQIAQTLIYLDDIKIGDFSDSFQIEIGPGKDILRKELALFTTIHDIQPETDRISMYIVISGGKKEEEILVYDTEVPVPGGLAHAQVRIIFI